MIIQMYIQQNEMGDLLEGMDNHVIIKAADRLCFMTILLEIYRNITDCVCVFHFVVRA